jgi:tetratricopeptide (TPR) repeat protein
MAARLLALVGCPLFLVLQHSQVMAADAEWRRLDTAHFSLLSNASERQTRTLAWQLEQVRSAIALVCPWARVDLSKPVLVIALKDERSMRTLAPDYWARQSGIHPASVGVEGPDRYYIALRADLRVQADSPAPVNPHLNAYFMYVSLLLRSSFDRELPLWFTRGLAGVLSNTIVNDDGVEVGRLIPDHLQRLRTYPSMPLKQLVTLTRAAKNFNDDDGLFAFDTQAWGLVHFLLFHENGVHRAKLATFASLVQQGTDAQAAFEQAFGSSQQLQSLYSSYETRGIYQFMRVKVDLGVKREDTPLVPVVPAAAIGERAAFAAAMGMAGTARESIDEARASDPAQPQSYVAEGLLVDQAGDRSAASAAFEKAIANGTDNAYAFYRAAALALSRHPEPAALPSIEKWLSEAIQRNRRFADAYATLGEVRAAMAPGSDVAAGLVLRAITLEPSEASHHLAAARVFWRNQKWDWAVTQARTAERLAQTDAARAEAQHTLAQIEAARPR